MYSIEKLYYTRLGYSLSGGSVPLFPLQGESGVYHCGIFHLIVEGTLMRPISLGEKMWFVKGTFCTNQALFQ